MASLSPDARAPSGPPPVSTTRILASAILASSVAFIDGSVTAIALPAIRSSLDASLAGAQWVQNGYMLTLASLTLVGGALGDRFGTARVFGLGIAGFTIASLVCALAPTTVLLISSRALQGMAAALMVPGSLALISQAFGPSERGRAIGTWSAASALTTVAGPLLGGLLLSSGAPWAWRLVFLINLPLGAAALLLLRPALALDRPRAGRDLDWLGAGLATLGLGLLAAGLTRAEGSGGAGLLALAGLAALAAFAWAQTRVRAPMMPPRLFADRGFALANLATLLLYGALSLTLFTLPMMLVAGWGLGELTASLALAPMSLVLFLLSSRFGAMAGRASPFRLIAAGSTTVAAGFLWLGFAGGGGSLPAVILAMTVAGFGMAMVVAPLSATVMAGASQDGGAASGINNAVSRVAGLMGVAAAGAVAAAVYARAGGPLSFGEEGAALGHRAAMGLAFRWVAWAGAALAAAAAGVALLGNTPSSRARPRSSRWRGAGRP